VEAFRNAEVGFRIGDKALPRTAWGSEGFESHEGRRDSRLYIFASWIMG